MKDRLLNLGIIFPSKKISRNNLELLWWCSENTNIKIKFVGYIKANQDVSFFIRLKKFLWFLILTFESYIFNSFRVDLGIAMTSRPKLKEVNNTQLNIKINKNNEYSLDLNEVQEIEKLKLDLLICFETTPLVNILKDSTKLGILSFHGNKNYPTTSLIGFEETLNKVNKTTFSIIYNYPKSSFPGFEVQKGAFPTHSYFLKNQENVFSRRNFYMQKLLSKIIDGDRLPQDKKTEWVERTPQDIPLLKNQIRYLISSLGMAVSRGVSVLIIEEKIWNVSFFEKNWKSLDFSKGVSIKNPTNHFLADPFIIKEEGKNFCFMEDYDLTLKKGTICAYEILNGKSIEIGKVLEEDFHLSFPYLFKYKNKIYMLPETSDKRDIRIYEPIKFPLQWKLKKIIKKDVMAVDSMIFEYNGLWWLFSNINPIGGADTCSELSAFFTDDPINGEWIPHSKNPIVFNPSKARNGGLLLDDKNIYRVGQRQEFGIYGGGFSVNKVIKLTKESYEEEVESTIYPDFLDNIEGTHHFHSNGEISVFDYLK